MTKWHKTKSTVGRESPEPDACGHCVRLAGTVLYLSSSGGRSRKLGYSIAEWFTSLYDSCNRDIYSFVKEIVKSEDDTIKASEAYATASLFIDPDGNHQERLRAILGDKCKETYSASYDARIKIGNKSFSVLLRTGGEENIQRYAVMEEGSFNSQMLYFLTLIEGDEINIYDCEIGNDVMETISGRFRVLYCRGIVIFEKFS